MDEESKYILKEVGLNIQELSDVDGILIQREQLLSDTKYEEIKKKIIAFKISFEEET